MKDDAKSGAATERNRVPMEDSNDLGDRARPLRDPGSTSPGRRMSMEENLDGVPGAVTLSALQRLFAHGRAPIICGVLWGVIQAAAPLGFWWLDPATVYGMSIALIAAVYIGFVGHGLKDLWQHRSHFVANTRWWPPFCMTIDFVAAAIIAVAIVSGVTFHQ